MSSIEPGTLVGRYRVIRLIAQGGMAEVYRAEQALTGGISRPVALKVIRPEYSESEVFREMFLDEARTACTLSHPHIVHLYEVGEVDGLLYLAMELVPGVPLSGVERTLRARGERFTDEALLAVGIATCAALEAVHARPGLVHRDVSPQNLLLTAGGVLKLIDFGIAKAATNRNLTRVGTTKGKAGYFSPEQARGKVLDGRSDLFSLGVTLYQLAAGVGPLDEHTSVQSRHTALVRGEWEPLSRVCPKLPRGLSAVVDRALRVTLEERFPDARAMREALEAVALEAGLPVGPGALAGYVREDGEEVSVAQVGPRRARAAVGAAAAVTASRSRAPGGRKVWAPVAGVAVGLALSAAGVAFLLPRKEPAPLARPAPMPRPSVVEVPASPPVVAETPAPASEPTPEPEPLLPSEPESPRPKRVTRRSRDVGSAVAAPTPAPAPVEEVLEGEGELRIGATQELMGRVKVKLPGRPLEELPVNLRSWKAGRSVLEFHAPEGTVRCEAKVRPDKRTRVVFNGRGCTVND